MKRLLALAAVGAMPAMKLGLGAVLLAAVTLAASACGSGHPTGSHTVASTRPTASRNPVSSSRLILDGAVRCTATVPSPVQVGDELGLSVKFENVSKGPVDVRPAYGGIWANVTSPDGTEYDTQIPLENASGPTPESIPLQPGATATRHLLPSLHVRWEGPLDVTPGCDLSGAPPLRVAVGSPGLPASAADAMNDVVAATGHLLDDCRPSKPGVPVLGQINPPEGDAPPLQARCSIDLHKKRGFYDAQVLVLTPPDLKGVHVEQPYETLSGSAVRNANTQALAWEFVVTRDGAKSVSSANYATSRHGSHMAPDWFWTSSGPKKGGDFRCGGAGGSSGNANGPDVAFVSFCDG